MRAVFGNLAVANEWEIAHFGKDEFGEPWENIVHIRYLGVIFLGLVF